MKDRLQDLSSAAKALAVNDDLEKSQQERADIFYKFVKVILLKFWVVFSAQFKCT